MIYLDNSATSPIAQEVFEAMRPYLQEEYGNPSSKYYPLAAHAADAVENSRSWVAKLIHAKPEEIIFTCGSTESTNMIIKGVADYKKYYEKKGNHIITSKVEHHATLNTCRFLNGDIYSNQDATFSLFGKVPKVDRGYEVTFLDVNEYGQVTPDSFEKAIRLTTTLASFIWANNEIGSLNDMDALTAVAHKHLINVNAQSEKCYHAAVSLFVENGSDKIEISRIIDLRGKLEATPSSKDFKCTLELIKNDVPLSSEEDEKADFINSLVHQDASQYFFFDGEKINDYSTASGSQYKDAIARVLGIKEVDNAVEDLGLLKKEFEKNRDAWIQTQNKYQDILQQKMEADQKVAEQEALLRQYEQEINAANEQIQKDEDKLKDFKEISEKVTQKQKLSEEIKQLTDDLKRTRQEQSECFQKNATLMLAASIFAKMQQDTSSEPTEYHITEPVKEYLVRLMEQPICVCGEPMTDSHKEKIQAFIQDHLVTDDAILVEKERRALFNVCAQYQPHGFQTRAAYFSLSEEIWKKEKERSAKKEEFEHLRKDIGSFNEEAGERIIQDIANMEVKKQEAETRRTKTQVLLEQDQEKLARLEEKLAELSQLDKEGALCQKKLENTIALEKIFSVYRNRLLEEKRAFVEKYATEVFLQITNAPQKYKGIKIASDYSLLLELTNGETYQIEPGRTLNPSTGQSKVISLSYIAGLNRSSDFAAPVIIDNPLGLFSDEHRAAITRFLPHMGKQVIFMVSTGDLTEKYQNELKPYVKTVYKLENHSDQTWPKTVIASKEVY